MKVSLLPMLSCPFCGGSLAFSLREPDRGDDVEHGLLACRCGEFAVLGGVPIFKKEGRVDVLRHISNEVVAVGPAVGHLRDLVRAGSPREALMLLLVPPAPSLAFAIELVEILPRFRSRLRRLVHRRWARAARKMEALFLGDSSRVTALDVFDYYYRRAMHSELYEYFAFRFAQPRYLGAVSLATLLPSSGRPTLDLACGFGHLLHYLTSTHPGRLFIGADRNFFQLYAAKRWIAPDAEFICADADQRLPFVSGSFGGVLCSDAFHYFPRKTQCVAELRRVVEERGVFVVARAGNARVDWKEGFELPPEGYRDLFSGLPFRIVSERALVRAYRTRMGPPLAAQPPLESLEDEKWLSFVATRREELFRDHPALTTWPHGVGRLRLNPLYRRLREDAAGNVLLELELPRGRYPLEHPDGRVGLPERVEVGAGILREIAAGERTPSVEELIANLVVLGVPTNYG